MSGWKGFERRCAKSLGGIRRPVTGIDRNDGDVFNAMFEIQCKVRQGQPSYLRKWLDGIVETAKARNKIGIVIWKESGRGYPDGESLVVLRLTDWCDLHGTPTVDEGATDPARVQSEDGSQEIGSAIDPSSTSFPKSQEPGL